MGMFDGHGKSFWRILMVMDQVFGMDGDHGQCLWGCLMVMDSVCGDV